MQLLCNEADIDEHCGVDSVSIDDWNANMRRWAARYRRVLCRCRRYAACGFIA